MNAIAWAIVWVALFYGPDVFRMTHGRELSDEGKATTGAFFLIVTAMFVWAAWPGR